MVSSALAQLEGLHIELQELIAELGAATACSVPDRTQLTTIRWQLSRTSRARTKLIETILLPHLRGHVSLADCEALGALHIQISNMSAESSRHVADWPIDRVLVEWDGYRVASAAIREAMTRRIAAEKALLYPLLRRRPLDARKGAACLPKADAG